MALALQGVWGMEELRGLHSSALAFPLDLGARPLCRRLRGRAFQLCLTLCNPMDCSKPGSSVHGIFQARVLEWGAIALEGPKCHDPMILWPRAKEEGNRGQKGPSMS